MKFRTHYRTNATDSSPAGKTVACHSPFPSFYYVDICRLNNIPKRWRLYRFLEFNALNGNDWVDILSDRR